MRPIQLFITKAILLMALLLSAFGPAPISEAAPEVGKKEMNDETVLLRARGKPMDEIEFDLLRGRPMDEIEFDFG